MKLSHHKLIIFSGLTWLAIGAYLLSLGLSLIFKPLTGASAAELPLIDHLANYIGGKEITALLLLTICLYVGYMKGRFVLGKSARRNITRILSLPNPAPVLQVYGLPYYLILGSMVLLGISIKYIGLNPDVRGLIDATIGSALINGSMIYFRAARCESC